MNYLELYYADIMALISPILTLSGFISLTIAIIVMLVNMVIDAFSGRGFKIRREK